MTAPQKSRQPNDDMRSSPQSTTGLAKEVRLIQIRMVRNMTKNGKIMSYSAAVVAGNLEGGIGYGVGKDKKPNDAVLKATRLAERDMEFFERYDNRTLFHDISVKFKATKVHVRAAPAGKLFSYPIFFSLAHLSFLSFFFSLFFLNLPQIRLHDDMDCYD